MIDILDILKALSDETRLRIISLLYEKELCVCDIMEVLQITQTKASRHLAYIKNSDIIADRKQAQWVYYSMIKTDDLKFLDSLVYDNLRNLELFKNDLRNLEEWLKRKNISCT
jgi:Predicted transcriptional regulators